MTTSFRKINLFLLTQTFTTPLILVTNDIIFQDQSSGAPRYLIAFQIGILLSVSYLLASKTQVNSVLAKQQNCWTIITLTLISVGVISGVLNVNTSPIYQKSRNFHNTAIANILNQASQPILLVDSKQTMDILSLSNNLDSKVKIQILSSSEKLSLAIPNCKDTETFIFNPSMALRNQLANQKQIQLEQIYKPNLLIPTETVLSLWSAKKLGTNCGYQG